MDFAAITLDPAAGAPLYRQLEQTLAAAIGAGALRAGDRLPSERMLAGLLGVSRTTAVNAYRELEARGLARGRVGSGTFVCAAACQGDASPFAWQGKIALGAQRTVDPTLRTLVRDADPTMISFAGGTPALDCFPLAVFESLTARVLARDAGAALGLGPTEGQSRFRAALARRLRVRPEQVLALSGSQQGLDLTARSLLDPGDAVVMDRPGYVGAIQTFRSAGAHVVGWDAGRADPDELEQLLQRYHPKLLYTNPTFHNPTGRTLSLETRREILRLAGRYRIPVVEDEPYRDLAFRAAPPQSLLDLDEQGLVIQLGTFSKTLAAGLRLGWLAAPELALIKQRCDLFTPGLTQLVLAELLVRGDYDAHLRTLRAEHARRRDAMTAALTRAAGALSWAPAAGGLYLWGRLGGGLDACLLAEAARAAGVAVVAGAPFFADGAGRHNIRLCFARTPPNAIALGVARLGRVMRELHAADGAAGALHALV